MTIPSAYGWSPEGWRKRNPVQRSQRIQRGRSRVNPGNKSRMGNHNRALGAHPTHLPVSDRPASIWFVNATKELCWHSYLLHLAYKPLQHRPGLSPHPCDIDKPLHRASPYTTSDIVPLIMITYRLYGFPPISFICSEFIPSTHLHIYHV